MAKQSQAKKSANAAPQRRNTRSRSPEDDKDIRDARRALKEARKKGSVPWEQVKRDVGI